MTIRILIKKYILKKIYFLNLLTIILILITCEILFRVLHKENCINNCSMKNIFSPNISSNDPIVNTAKNFIVPDEEIGYKLNTNYENIINLPNAGWFNILIKTDSNGFRIDNKNIKNNAFANTLVVGDSFTFGDQVNNEDGWPNCISKKLKINVDNAGVGGYSAYQAYLRINYEMSKRNYDSVIQSILVGHDFQRDGYLYQYGFPRPYIDSSLEDEYDFKKNGYLKGSLFNPDRKFIISFLYKYIYIFSVIVDRYFPRLDFNGIRVDVKKKNFDSKILMNIVVEKFSKIKIKNKIFLLQYGSDINGINIQEERLYLTKLLIINKIKYIDTYDILNKYTIPELWFVELKNQHHKPFANKEVCNLIATNFRSL